MWSICRKKIPTPEKTKQLPQGVQADVLELERRQPTLLETPMESDMLVERRGLPTLKQVTASGWPGEAKAAPSPSSDHPQLV